MAVLNQALAARGNIPPPGDPNPAPQPAPPQMDPVAMLLDEYKRLTPDDTPKPMFTPEQQNERIDRNNNLSGLGVLGSLTSDRPVNSVGGQVFKQALADRAERRTDRGIVDPLTGNEALDPEYVRANQENKRGQILQRALAFQGNRMASEDRRAASAERGDVLRAVGGGHDDARVAAAELRAASASAQPSMIQVKDDTTGKTHWFNPKTMQYMGEVSLPGAPGAGPSGAPGAPTPILRPGAPSGGDEKELTAVATGSAAAKMAIKAATEHPDAFGPLKGLPDMMGQGVGGSVARYVRDNKNLTPDQIAARSIIYNNVSAIIKERAGTAQSAQELKRLQGFLPSEMDDAPAILAKMKAFDQYLTEKGIAVRSKYAGGRPMQHMGGQQPGPAVPPPGAPSSGGGLHFNPATGEIEQR